MANDYRMTAWLLPGCLLMTMLAGCNSDDADQFDVAVQHRLCQDPTSGMPYPDQVEVIVGKERLRDCGGSPISTSDNTAS